MRIIEKNIKTEIVEKKSKFIANIYKVDSCEEAEKVLKEIKKKYHDAKHNCFAYRVYENENIVERVSDDGEPSGTAGMPILEILKGNEIVNCIAIVTRYFGGILLGTGGLVRAYSGVITNAIEEISCNEVECGYEIEIEISYKEVEKLEYYCRINKLNIVKKEYNENIIFTIEVDEEKKEELCNNTVENKFNITKSRIMSKKLIRKIR